MKPLKIMMVVDNLDIGGTETHALEIAKSLQLRGHKLIIGTMVDHLLKNFNNLVYN